MCLHLLGRGGTRRWRDVARIGALHVCSAAVGGAALGLIVGGLGNALGLPAWRTVVLLPAIVAGGVLAIASPGRKFGLQRQVPRSWLRTKPPAQTFALWGLMLGSGALTMIPYSSFIVLLAALGTSTAPHAILAGMSFGATREVIAIMPPKAPWDFDRLADTLLSLRGFARVANLAVIVAGGIVLLIS